ncbi:MAG: DNA-directed RNA polymerase, partial [Nanoarchaeota archaeon]|nr:DNA-directed RNA polymerase [Nanoarchaeota archaeon]
NQSLKVNDKCQARIIAVSYKDINRPKIGLTMRQEGLGKIEWLQQQHEEKAVAQEEKKEK